MKPRTCFVLIAVLIVLLAAGPQPACAQSSDSAVHAVIFYSPDCGHCYYLITEVLPPLFDQYGNQLQMIGIDISQTDGYQLFLNVLQNFSLEEGGVPLLVVGDTFLMGSVDIPEKFPGLIEYYLARGGVDWPDIPGFAGLMAAAESTQAAQPSPMPLPTASVSLESVPATDPEPTAVPDSLILTGAAEASLADRLAQDPAGNGLAIIVLIGIIISVGWGGWRFQRTPGHRMTGAVLWRIPALCIVGLGVAGYLSYVENAQVEAVCGPVGDCNTVQQSEYARLFGILSIGVMGMVGYVAIIAAWFVGQQAKGKLADFTMVASLALTVFGTLFSIYLTFLEPFVIGVTCAWCLCSAIIMTILMLIFIAPGKLAVSRLMRRNR